MCKDKKIDKCDRCCMEMESGIKSVSKYDCRIYQQLEESMLIKKLLFDEIVDPLTKHYERKYKEYVIRDIYYSLKEEGYVVKYVYREDRIIEKTKNVYREEKEEKEEK